MEKTDLASAYRRLKSPNIKTRKRALKIIKEAKRNQIKKQWNLSPRREIDFFNIAEPCEREPASELDHNKSIQKLSFCHLL